MPRPDCGINIPGSSASNGDIVAGVVGVAGSVISIGAGIAKIVTGTAAAAAPIPIIGAIVAAAVVVAVVIYFAVERCRHPEGERGCMAGVIERITPAFSDAGSSLFAFASPHDRVDLVVKQQYWDFIDVRSEYVFCSDADQSPMVPCFYYTPAVCNAGIGASVGAGVGAVAGVIVAAVAIAAIGCATIILCILALIVAVLIAAVAAIICAVAGGEIGRAATPQPGPSAGDEGSGGAALTVGEYISAQGTLLKSGDLDNALVFYFVTHTTVHGNSTGSPSFSHTDPDANLVPDACPVR